MAVIDHPQARKREREREKRNGKNERKRRKKIKERKRKWTKMFGDFDLLYLTNKTTIISKNKERKKGFDS